MSFLLAKKIKDGHEVWAESTSYISIMPSSSHIFISEPFESPGGIF